MSATGIEAIVCADIERRQAMGIQKYGVTVADNPLPLREWLQHAYEETLDKAIYLRRAIAEIDGPTPAKGIPTDHPGQFRMFDDAKDAWDTEHQLCFAYRDGRWRARLLYTLQEVGQGMTCDAARRDFAKGRGVPLWGGGAALEDGIPICENPATVTP